MLIAKDSWSRRFNRRRSTKRLLGLRWFERRAMNTLEEEERQLDKKRKEKRQKEKELLREETVRKEKMRAAVWRWEDMDKRG